MKNSALSNRKVSDTEIVIDGLHYKLFKQSGCKGCAFIENSNKPQSKCFQSIKISPCFYTANGVWRLKK